MTQSISLDPGKILALNCPKCVYLTLSLAKLCEHCSSHEDRIICELFQCSSCGIISSNSNLMLEHIQSVHPHSKLELKRIMNLTLNEGDSSTEAAFGPHRCLLCSVGVANSDALRLHYQSHHNIINANSPMSRLPDSRAHEFQNAVEDASPDLGLGTSPSDLSMEDDKLNHGVILSRSIKTEAPYEPMERFLPNRQNSVFPYSTDDVNHSMFSLRGQQSQPSSSRDGFIGRQDEYCIDSSIPKSEVSSTPLESSQIPAETSHLTQIHQQDEMQRFQLANHAKQQQIQQQKFRNLEQLKLMQLQQKLQQHQQQQQQQLPQNVQTSGWKLNEDTILRQFDFAPRKSIGRWRTEDMVAAFEAVTMQGMTLRKAARNFNVPFATLQRRLSGKVKFKEYYGAGRLDHGPDRWNQGANKWSTPSNIPQKFESEDVDPTKEELHEMQAISEQRQSVEMTPQTYMTLEDRQNSEKPDSKWTLDQ